MLALQLNRLTLLLAVGGAFLAVTYPFVKRFLSVPQLYLGLAFGWGIPMAFAAQLESRAARRVAAADRQHAVGDRVRHHLRHGRPQR